MASNLDQQRQERRAERIRGAGATNIFGGFTFAVEAPPPPPLPKPPTPKQPTPKQSTPKQPTPQQSTVTRSSPRLNGSSQVTPTQQITPSSGQQLSNITARSNQALGGSSGGRKRKQSEITADDQPTPFRRTSNTPPSAIRATPPSPIVARRHTAAVAAVTPLPRGQRKRQQSPDKFLTPSDGVAARVHQVEVEDFYGPPRRGGNAFALLDSGRKRQTLGDVMDEIEAEEDGNQLNGESLVLDQVEEEEGEEDGNQLNGESLVLDQAEEGEEDEGEETEEEEGEEEEGEEEEEEGEEEGEEAEEEEGEEEKGEPEVEVEEEARIDEDGVAETLDLVNGYTQAEAEEELDDDTESPIKVVKSPLDNKRRKVTTSENPPPSEEEKSEEPSHHPPPPKLRTTKPQPSKPPTEKPRPKINPPPPPPPPTTKPKKKPPKPSGPRETIPITVHRLSKSSSRSIPTNKVNPLDVLSQMCQEMLKKLHAKAQTDVGRRAIEVFADEIEVRLLEHTDMLNTTLQTARELRRYQRLKKEKREVLMTLRRELEGVELEIDAVRRVHADESNRDKDKHLISRTLEDISVTRDLFLSKPSSSSSSANPSSFTPHISELEPLLRRLAEDFTTTPTALPNEDDMDMDVDMDLDGMAEWISQGLSGDGLQTGGMLERIMGFNRFLERAEKAVREANARRVAELTGGGRGSL